MLKMALQFNFSGILTVSMVLVSVGLNLVKGQESVIVTADDLGQIRGLKVITNRGAPYFTFTGVPYAQDPSGVQRFKPSVLRTGPLLPEEEQPFNATRLAVICPQKALLGDESSFSGDEAMLRAILDHPSSELNRSQFGIPTDEEAKTEGIDLMAMGNEDCLTLNINTPFIPEGEPKPEELLPVIVYIHGGSFMSFWSTLFNGGRLLNRKVLLVSINYRLGVLGFFNLGIDDAPGNAGLYDAVTALQWIQKYIKYFGGDPKRVIVTGQSAGAAAAVHLMAAPAVLTQDLFHGVIACSGTAFQQWAITDDPITHSLIIAEKLGCHVPPNPVDKPAILACMQDEPHENIVKALSEYRDEDRKNRGLGFFAGCPSVQASSEITDKVQKILPEHPFDTFANGKQKNIPIIVGTTRHDGSFVLQEAYDDFLVPNELESNATYIRTQLLADILKIMGMEDKTYGVIQSIADTFIGDNKHSEELKPLFPGLIDMFSVFFYKALGFRTAEFQSPLNPKSYVFSFDHKGMWSLHAITNIGGPIRGGVSHTDDQIYLFQWLPLLLQKDKEVANRWVEMWVNFATYLNPNGPDDGNLQDDTWPPYPKYLRVGTYGQDLIDTVGENYRDDWKQIAYDLYPPIDESSSTTSEAEPSTSEIVSTSTDPSNPPDDGSTTPAESSGSDLRAKSILALSIITLRVITFIRSY